MSGLANCRAARSVELTVPADASMLLVVRLTTAGVLARLDLTVDKIDDIKMAVEEAVNCLIGQTADSERVALAFSREKGRLTIVASLADARREGCPGSIDPQEMDVVRCLLEALVDEARLDVCGEMIRQIALVALLPD